ncbi:hypothetical protein ACFOYW_17745 [Gryllotalpicola reticulitermitis]|uniref:Lipoprotein n=1 Tax=Gryllotalpicola reticulitermitis TaxID=1184153 RepID=A0ABV8QA11_9MICO
MTPRTRLAAALGSGVVALGLLSGCSSTTAASTKAPLTADNMGTSLAAAETRAASVDMHTQVIVNGKPTVTIDADVIYPTTAGTPAPSPRPSVKSTVINPYVSETVTIAKTSTAVKLVVAGGKAWVNLGESTGDHYVAAASAPSAVAKAAKPYAQTAHQADPIQLSRQLRAAIVFAQRSGPDTTIAGKRVTPYLVAVNTAKAGDLLLGAGTDAASLAALPAEVDADLWIGADGLPSRESIISGQFDEETTFTKWGSAGSFRESVPTGSIDAAGPTSRAPA